MKMPTTNTWRHSTDGRVASTGASTGAFSPLTELAELEAADGFVTRHIGPSESDIAAMLHVVGAATLEDLAAKTVPPAIRSNRALDLPPAIDEAGVLAELRALADRNVSDKNR